MSSLQSETLTQQLANLIEEQILNGTFKVGMPLREIELEKMFGTSRTPLREALRYLENQGLIETFPRRGCFVKKISIKEITDIAEIRIDLEALAVRLAHKQLTKEGLKNLKSELAAMERALKRKNSRDFMEHHERYHAALIRMTGNSWLEKELTILRKIMRWHRFYFDFSEKNFSYSLESHKLQFQMLSDPKSDDRLLTQVDAETTRRGCELLLQHIKDNHLSR